MCWTLMVRIEKPILFHLCTEIVFIFLVIRIVVRLKWRDLFVVSCDENWSFCFLCLPFIKLGIRHL